MRSATRDMVNSHASQSGLSVRRLTPNLSHAIALAIAALALALTSSAAFAAGLTVHLNPPSAGSFACDLFLGCQGTLSGPLTDATQPGTYSAQFALDGPTDTSGTQLCFTPTSGGINQTILTFTKSGAAGKVTLKTGTLCLPSDVSLETGSVTVPFTVTSGTGDFTGASGTGTITGGFAGSILGGSQITFATVSSPNFSVPSGGGCTASCPPPPGNTPELDSLLLFGSGLSGLVAYAVRRHRAGKLTG